MYAAASNADLLRQSHTEPFSGKSMLCHSSVVNHLASAISPSSAEIAVEVALHLTMKKRLLLPSCARFPPWFMMKAPKWSKVASTPVSSLTSRTAATCSSSPASTRPVGSFQIPRRAAGPLFSLTSSTRFAASVTMAPTPTVWLAFIGKVLGTSVGSHLVSMTCRRSAWWKSKPKSAVAIGMSSALSMPSCSQTPRFLASDHSASDARNILRNVSGAWGTDFGSTITPP
mmetsp:Transcript_40986/g.112715  ORF Transcript_40986/g.112715 Transcript_40986/m.112715 type:complete len:229 (+) Transcript_40986:144-830(+)